MPAQLPLPLQTPAKCARADFIVGAGNSAAVAFVDTWPHWSAPAAALFGPSGSGKSHLAGVWAERAGAAVIAAGALQEALLVHRTPLVIENVDAAPFASEAEAVLFAFLERGQNLLLTAHERPTVWSVVMPDLRSRFAALLSFPLWVPDEALLEALAKKLFADRQLVVPDAVITQMIRALERSPGAVRDFVARADAAALAQKRPINLGLIRELLASG
jgi:chromosomal replication initiation ATPase DnaA